MTVEEKRGPKVKVGDIVEVDLDFSGPSEDGIEINLYGRCCLYIVNIHVGETGSYLYTVSDLPVVYPKATQPLDPQRLLFRSLATVVEHVYEDQIRPTPHPTKTLTASLEDWFSPLTTDEQAARDLGNALEATSKQVRNAPSWLQTVKYNEQLGKYRRRDTTQ